ncbi:hypothetical protein TH2_144 [Shewanella phage Thanatos-2]|nr:hypothetical protein TH2_144 [Shewanella phage Thanatos-2]
MIALDSYIDSEQYSEALLVILKDLKESIDLAHSFDREYYGNSICTKVSLSLKPDNYHIFKIFKNIMSTLFKSWPKFSGNINYPVPSQHSYFSHRKEYMIAADYNLHWLGEYGKARYELLEHMVKTLETKLGKINE